MSVAIIDYKMGNVASVQKALNFLKIENAISYDKEVIKQADYIILPGVGSFKQGMDNLEELGLIEILNEEVIGNKKPFLGVCLGMQLIAEFGTEPIDCNGLGWVKGTVVKMQEEDKRIPHLGWNTIKAKANSFIENFQEDFYFIHSYHFKVENAESIAATVNYGNDYVAAVQQGNIYATQFHPEKSQTAGLGLLKHFFANAKG